MLNNKAPESVSHSTHISPQLFQKHPQTHGRNIVPKQSRTKAGSQGVLNKENPFISQENFACSTFSTRAWCFTVQQVSAGATFFPE
jgi:hypothetical protein